MWSFISAVGSSEPQKMGPIFKGTCHPNTPLRTILGSVSPFATFLPDKQFPTFKKNISQSMPCQHYQKTDEVSSSRPIETPKNDINQTCNNNTKKKKKKRRRRRKKKNNQQQNQATLDNPSDNKFVQWRRTREISTTESEDSFIVFFDEHDDISKLSDNETETTEDLDSSDSIIPHKKVRFANDSQLCEIHPMVMWSFAYQAARKGPWEEYARDRFWFKKRVANTEAEIGHVFSPEHRSRIFRERFA